MPEPAKLVDSSTRYGRLAAALGPMRVADDTNPLIVKASGEVMRGWAQALGSAFDAEETSSILEMLSNAIEHASKGAIPERGQGASALARFLLERIASVLISLIEADTSISREEAIRLMKAVDVVRRAIEPDWDQYFSSQLSGPDGLNLVVAVAHDIRSPLTSIRCLAETLERGHSGPVTEVQRKQLRLIYSASLGLSSMATDVIEMARRGDLPSEQEPMSFSVSETIESVLDMVRPIAEEKGLTMRFGGPTTDQRIGRPIALSRVLLNLTTNALKFTDEGSVEILTRPVGPTRLEFSVRDTGRGISEEALASLYQPFRRSSGRAARSSGFLFSGTGLGLAMCRKLLGMLDSELQFETAAGQGTRFFFELELPPVTRL